MDGGRFSSASLHGRVALLNFWASWCAPCRSELPALDSLRREVAYNGFAFVGINEEEDTAAARAFMNQRGFAFPVAFGRGRLRPLFHYPGLPYTVLLDRKGRIAGRWIGYAGPGQIQAMRALIRSELSRGEEHGRHGSLSP
jgi:thiol-disulfide isomerase/thioredoxin